MSEQGWNCSSESAFSPVLCSPAYYLGLKKAGFLTAIDGAIHQARCKHVTDRDLN